MASLALLASSLVKNLKQNDKFAKTIIYALIIYFSFILLRIIKCTRFDSQLSPIASKGLMPLIITFLSILIYQSDKLKNCTYHD